jgi:uncharacterized protein YggE
MIRYAIPLLALSALAAPVGAAEVQIQSQGPVVELSVSDTVNAKPDVARLGAGVTLHALGIADKDIQTSGYNLNAQFTYPPQGGTPTFAGYDASNQVTVKLRQMDKVGDVLDALVDAGANNIFGPSFMLDDLTATQAAARAEAFKRGQALAQDYARMSGYTGVRLLEVSESVQGGGPVPPAPPPVAYAVERDASTPIAPGEVGTMVTLTLKYEMTR